LVVVEDTVRADALSTYGNARLTSPQLDALAVAGVVFEDVTAPASWTWPSHASLFTGEPPWVHGAHAAKPGPDAVRFKDAPFLLSLPRQDLPTLAERFAQAGYRTASVSANPFLDPDIPRLLRGFEQVFYDPSDRQVVEIASAILATPDERPLFLFVNLFGAHLPYTVQPAPWLQEQADRFTAAGAPDWMRPLLVEDQALVDLQRPIDERGTSAVAGFVAGTYEIPQTGLVLLRDLYEGEVRRVDHELSRLLSAWNDRMGADAVVAVTSDHGELLGERGLLSHGRLVFPELTQIPLVLSAPGRLPPGHRVHDPVQLHDLFDTLLDLAGVSQGERSLVSLATGGASRPGPIQAAAWPDVGWANQIGGVFRLGHRLYREGDHAVIVRSDGEVSLYDLNDDPMMRRDLAPTDPARAQSLAAAAAGAFPEVITETAAPPAATLEKLQALGYLE
jgi:arylsulfatase A-like enzyme